MGASTYKLSSFAVNTALPPRLADGAGTVALLMEGGARGLAVGLSVGGREAAGVSKPPTSRDPCNSLAGRRVGRVQVVVSGVETDTSHVGHGCGVEVMAERVLQRSGGDMGGVGDVGDRDIGFCAIFDEGHRAVQCGGVPVVMVSAAVSGKCGVGERVQHAGREVLSGG
jgi:hypothetical protein